MVIETPPSLSSRGRHIHGRLRLKHLQLIEILSRTGNLGKAATELALTQSAASKILQDAEAIFGASLFERQARGLSPNSVGLAVIHYARNSLNRASKIISDVEALSLGGAGSLAVGAIMVSTPDILPAAISELQRRKPLLIIRLTATTSDKIVEMIGSGEIDVGLCRLVNSNQNVLYQFEELFDEALWVFVEKSHPLTRKGATSFVELVDYSWVMQPPTTPSREVLEAAFAAAGAKMPRTRVETTSRFATLQLVKYAGMVGLLPSTILAEYVARGDLVKLDVGTLRPTSRYGLVTRRDEPQNDHVRDFAAIVRSVRRAGESCERS